MMMMMAGPEQKALARNLGARIEAFQKDGQEDHYTGRR